MFSCRNYSAEFDFKLGLYTVGLFRYLQLNYNFIAFRWCDRRNLHDDLFIYFRITFLIETASWPAYSRKVWVEMREPRWSFAVLRRPLTNVKPAPRLCLVRGKSGLLSIMIIALCCCATICCCPCFLFPFRAAHNYRIRCCGSINYYACLCFWMLH